MKLLGELFLLLKNVVWTYWEERQWVLRVLGYRQGAQVILDALPVIMIAAAIVLLPLVDWRRG